MKKLVFIVATMLFSLQAYCQCDTVYGSEIEIESFTISATEGGYVLIEWTTSSEKHNVGFLIRRLNSDGNWFILSNCGCDSVCESLNYYYVVDSFPTTTACYDLHSVDVFNPSGGPLPGQGAMWIGDSLFYPEPECVDVELPNRILQGSCVEPMVINDGGILVVAGEDSCDVLITNVLGSRVSTFNLKSFEERRLDLRSGMYLIAFKYKGKLTNPQKIMVY